MPGFIAPQPSSCSGVSPLLKLLRNCRVASRRVASLGFEELFVLCRSHGGPIHWAVQRGSWLNPISITPTWDGVEIANCFVYLVIRISRPSTGFQCGVSGKVNWGKANLLTPYSGTSQRATQDPHSLEVPRLSHGSKGPRSIPHIEQPIDYQRSRARRFGTQGDPPRDSVAGWVDSSNLQGSVKTRTPPNGWHRLLCRVVLTGNMFITN